MHKALVNRCDITLMVACSGPFAVLEGRYQKEDKVLKVDGGGRRELLDDKIRATFPDHIPVSLATGPDLWQRIQLAGNDGATLTQKLSGLPFYIPGASLRGAMRSYAEKILRTLSPPEGYLCCNPFELEGSDRFCGKELEAEKSSPNAYKRQCPACALFGSTRVAGRVRVEDFKIHPPGRLVIRDGIALDRFTGGVSNGPFRSLLLEGYTFEGRLTIHNFECWHLGLMAYVLRDFCDGKMPMGWGRGKGYGGIEATIETVTLTYWGNRGLQRVTRLEGIEHRGYAEYTRGAMADCKLPDGILSTDASGHPHPFRHVYRVTKPGMGGVAPFWGSVAAAFDAAHPHFTPIAQPPQDEGETEEEAA